MPKKRPKLAEALKEAGFAKHIDDFKVIVLEVFHGQFPDWTDEEMLYHPADAIIFCDAVKREAGIELACDVILACLVNCRKNGFGLDHTT